MVKRNNHYEKAFEAYLRTFSIAYVAVNEQRRALLAGPDFSTDLPAESSGPAISADRLVGQTAVSDQTTVASNLLPKSKIDSLKSLDFIISQPSGPTWLVDVKGRQFPTAGQYFRNWTTNDEIASLRRWQALFGGGFRSVLIFAYNIVGDKSPLPAEQLFEFAGALYGFVAIELDEYASNCKPLSQKWDTVTIPTERFRSLAKPIQEFVGPSTDPIA